MQDAFGCHLVCSLDAIGHVVSQQRPHPDEATCPFKRGKLTCSCGGNIGNIQNNVQATLPTVGLLGRGEYAVLKFANLSFAVTPSQLIPRLTGALLGQAVGFVTAKGGKGGGRGGSKLSVARSINPAHVLEAAGRTQDLQRLLQAEEERRLTPATLAPATSGASAAANASSTSFYDGSTAHSLERPLSPVAQAAPYAGKSGDRGGSKGEGSGTGAAAQAVHGDELDVLDDLQGADTVVAALHSFVLACGGEISSTSGVADFYKHAGALGEAFKQTLRNLGPKEKSAAYASVGLVYQKRAVGSDVIKLADNSLDSASTASNGSPGASQSCEQRSPCVHFAKGWCKYADSCCFRHEDTGPLPFFYDASSSALPPKSKPPPPPLPITSALVKFVSTDKNGRLFGYAKPRAEAAEKAAEKAARKEDALFFMHGMPPQGGFKNADGVLLTAGLRLEAADGLDRLQLVKSTRGDMQIFSACLAKISSSSNVSQRLHSYLTGLKDALEGDDGCGDALSSLCQEEACAVVWKAIAQAAASNKRVAGLAIEAIIALARVAENANGSARPLARSALQNVLGSGVDLDALVAASVSRSDHEEIVHALARAVGSVWVLVPSARCAIFDFLRTLTRTRPAIAASVLGPQMLLKLVGAMMPGRDALRRYDWSELPLRLVTGEIEGSDTHAQSTAVLQAVQRDGGTYDDFDACELAR